MLLDGANILDWQRQLRLTSTTNNTKFDKIADALMVQLGRIHVKDRTYGGHHKNEDKLYRQPVRQRF